MNRVSSPEGPETLSVWMEIRNCYSGTEALKVLYWANSSSPPVKEYATTANHKFSTKSFKSRWSRTFANLRSHNSRILHRTLYLLPKSFLTLHYRPAQTWLSSSLRKTADRRTKSSTVFRRYCRCYSLRPRTRHIDSVPLLFQVHCTLGDMQFEVKIVATNGGFAILFRFLPLAESFARL